MYLLFRGQNAGGIGFYRVDSNASGRLLKRRLNPFCEVAHGRDTIEAMNLAKQHLDIGLDALRDLRDRGESVKHLRFE